MVGDLIAGRGIRTFRYPPAFPLILAGIHHIAGLLGIAERGLLGTLIIACTGLSSATLYLVARRLWPPAPSLAISLAWTTYLPFIFTTAYVSSETPFTLFLFAAMLAYFSGLSGNSRNLPAFLVCGLALGLAMLTRPIAVGSGLVLAISTMAFGDARRQTRIVQGAAILVGNLLVVLPWQTYVYAESGRVVLLSTGGTPSILDGLTYAVDPSEQRNVRLPTDVEELQRDIFDRQYVQLNSVSEILGYLAAESSRRPATVAKLFAIKALDGWYRTDSTRHDSVILALQIPYLLLILVSTGLILWRRRGDHLGKAALVIWTMVFYFWGMTTITLSILRYMVPVIGLLFLLIPEVFVGRGHPQIRGLATARLLASRDTPGKAP